MVKFDVKPTLTVKADNDIAAECKITTSKWGNDFSVTLSDQMIKDGLSTNGLRLGMKAASMELEYGVSKNSAKFTFRSGFTVKDKDVSIKYVHAVNAGSEVEATVPVDDDNKCVLTYDLTNYDGPNYKNLRVKWVHTHKDFTVEPAFNLGTEAVSAKVTYKVDDENKLAVIYDTKSQHGTLEWTNDSNFGGDGTLKLTAKSVMDADSIKKMPTIMLEKTWGVDL